MYGMKINKDQSNDNRVYYSELVVAREAATITGIWQRFKGRQESGKALEKKKKNVSGML